MVGFRRVCCWCCHVPVDANALPTRFRRWYHRMRHSENEEKFPPLRHDSEVIIKELHRLFKMVRTLTLTAEKSQHRLDQLTTAMEAQADRLRRIEGNGLNEEKKTR